MRSKIILVTGGAGYIGSHVVRQLGDAGLRVIVLDDLSKGFRDAVLFGELIVGSIGDGDLLQRIFSEHKIDAVLHFAAYTVVPESVAHPLEYYRNNTCNTRILLENCLNADVRHFIFSSSAAVYGVPDGGGIVSETAPTRPINPYGRSKLATEWLLRDLSMSSNLRHVTLRYFNVAGSDPEGRIGQSTPDATLLIKVACEAATGKRDSVTIFGVDYPTPDGTGVRDYLHVEDLARAHLDALEYLWQSGDSITLNCGYGHGYSVREVLDTVSRVNGKPLAIFEAEARPGDSPSLIAKAKRIKDVLHWNPRYDDLDFIVSTSLAWENRLRSRSP
uniref:UDP-glucose 4-epimerase n=1 Tax=Candidatus Kentrum sp. UNK TaxID=2126344 RepID=A0A451ATL8_9GAMM|nr:MAG: UDP-galactose 4-epimerase [Candidatus Kentron sp. UNK]VFK69376.1 MAG: UDP-galactose 4-epimerase [Candidatus Kentron sp. UNK]